MGSFSRSSCYYLNGLPVLSFTPSSCSEVEDSYESIAETRTTVKSTYSLIPHILITVNDVVHMRGEITSNLKNKRK